MAKRTEPAHAPRLADIPFIGREAKRERLATAYASNHLPQVMLLTGEAGIGKQRLALWIAQMVLCPNIITTGPCGVCDSCRQALNLSHPDLLLYLPHPSLGSGDADQMAEKAETARIELIEARRNDALYDAAPVGASYQVAMIRLLKRDLSKRAYTAWGRRIVILPEAHLLTPREGADQSANALLKTLEEPPQGTYFILTSSVPDRVLSTIRSRTIEIQIPPLTGADVCRILVASRGKDSDLEEAVQQSGGSVTAARQWMDEEWQATRLKALSFLEAVLSPSRAQMYDKLGDMEAKNARGAFAALLDEVQQILFQACALTSAAHEGFAIDPRLSADHRVTAVSPLAWNRCLKAALAARAQAERNATPQLVLTTLAGSCRNSLEGATGTTRATRGFESSAPPATVAAAPNVAKGNRGEQNTDPCPW